MTYKHQVSNLKIVKLFTKYGIQYNIKIQGRVEINQMLNSEMFKIFSIKIHDNIRIA